jgi:ribosome maturation factor RimP
VPGHRQPGSTPTQAVRDALSPALADLGLHLEDVTLSPAGNRRVLRVVVDAADASAPALSLDDVADASRSVSDLLDQTDVLGETPYVLEVSTPGVDRPLTEPRHFRRNVGRLVRVTLTDGGSVEGRVRSADDDLVLTVAGPAKGTTSPRVLEWAQVARGHVQVEFSHRDEGS